MHVTRMPLIDHLALRDIQAGCSVHWFG